MAFFPAAVATDANLYVAVNSLQTTLSTAINSIVTSVVLTSATGFPTAGAVTIDNEVIFYTNISGSTLTGCTRGADGTTAAAHSAGVPVGATIVAFHHNGLKDEIIAVETFLNAKMGTSGSAYSTAKALQTNSSTGIIEVSAVTNTELGYLSGVTSAIQTQINTKAPTASPTFTGVVTVALGTVSAPSVIFTGNASSGLFNDGTANHINFASNGVEVARIEPGFFRVLSSSNIIGGTNTQIQMDNGTVSLPSYSFTNQTNTGFFRIGTSDIGVSTDGVQRAHIDTSALTMALPIAMGSNKITDLAAATANGDAVRYEQNIMRQAPVQATSNGSDSTTSTSFTDTSVSVTITPTSSSSRIKISVFGLGLQATAGTGLYTIARGSTDLSAGNGFVETEVIGKNVPLSMCYIDSPATTSATTYKVRFRTNSAANTTFFGDSRTTVMIAEEII